MNNNEIMKALSPEEMTMLSNIQSIIGELIGQNQAAAPTDQSVEVSKEQMSTTDDMETAVDDKDVKKEMVTSTSDSATASDDATKRIDETQTEESEDNVNEVAKALLQVFKTKKKQDKPVNPLVSTIKQIAEVQKSTQEQINELATAFSQLIKGIGIVEQMEVHKSKIDKKEPEHKPIYAEDMEKAFKSILESVQKTEPAKDSTVGRQSNNDIIRKNLSNPTFLKAAIANRS